MIIFQRLIRFFKSNRLSQVKVVRVLFIAFMLNILFGVLFYFAEKDLQSGLTLVDSIWWAMVTMTTVGYGDFYAESFAGRFLISYPCMLIGIGIIGYLVGVVAENIIEHGAKKRKGLLEITMKDHLIICNYPGSQKIIRLLDEIKRSVQYKDSPIILVTEAIEELPAEFAELKLRFVKGDPVREDILLKANIKECLGVFILAEDPNNADSDNKTFAIGTQIEMIEREINHPIKVVVEMVSMQNLRMMQRSKVDGIVTADGIMDAMIAQEFLYPGIHDIFQELLSNAQGSQFYILETKGFGKTWQEIQRKVIDYSGNIQVIGIERKDKKYLNPDKNMRVEKDDKIIVLAVNRSEYEQFEEQAF